MANKTLYDYEEEEKKKKKKRKKKVKKTKKIVEPSNQIDSDNEIIIGVTVYPNKNEKKTKEKKKKQKYNKKNAQNKIKRVNVNQKTKKINTITKENPKRNSKLKKVLRRTSILLLIIGMVVFALVSPIFNITKVKVTGNNKLSSKKIIGMTGLEIGQNVFKINKSEIIKNIRKNGLVSDVEIKRNLPDEIEIIVSERVASFAIEYGNGYVIVSNQGYIIELSETNQNLPILIGTVTKEEDYVENNRLEEQDLNALNLVLKIMNAANVNEIDELISSIDISDLTDVKINLDAEGKIAYLGDCSNLSHRIQWVKTILEDRQGIDGEIVVNMNLNTKDPFFREKLQ